MAATEVRMISTSGIVGYGFPEASLKRGLERKPHMIGADGGSSDPGPHYLGSGKSFTSRLAQKRDIRVMLNAAISGRIPMVIGTCGGAGAEPHLHSTVELVREIAREDGLSFRMAVIHSEQKKDWLHRRLADGKVRALGNAPALTASDVDRAERIVGMMGPEPYLAALESGAQVILGGRSTDAAPWAALAMHHGLPPATGWYAGKMLECACNAAVPKGHDCLLATVTNDYVETEPTSPDRRCTPHSVAVQLLHEKPSPIHFHEPGGMLDTSRCSFDALTERVVRTSGMTWQPQPYTIKLEAAELVGYSAITFAGTRDPDLIARIDVFLEEIRAAVATKVKAFDISPEQYQIVFRLYGRNGVMGDWEPVTTPAHELGILAEAVAKTQEIANAVVSVTRVSLLHTDFPGRLCKEGNMAFPFSPSDIERGPVYQFSMQHVVEPDDPLAMFPIEYETV